MLTYLACFKPTHTKKDFIRNTCGIETEDIFVVTGGNIGGNAIRNVQVYNISGPQSRLPDMKTARMSHGCGSYVEYDKLVGAYYLLKVKLNILSLLVACPDILGHGRK